MSAQKGFTLSERSESKGFAPILIILLITVILGAGGFFIYQNRVKNTVLPENDMIACTQEAKLCPDGSSVGRTGPNCEFTACPTPSPSIYSTSKPEIATNWLVRTNSSCNVIFAIPPKQEPYYYPYDPTRRPSVTEDKGSGRFWEYQQSGNNSTVIFKAPTEASGFVAGLVSVDCDGVDGNQSVESWITSKDGVIKDTIEIWGKMVLHVRYEGGMDSADYYIFKAKNIIYSVRKLSMSNTKLVKDTTEQIFNKLQFKD